MDSFAPSSVFPGSREPSEKLFCGDSTSSSLSLRDLAALPSTGFHGGAYVAEVDIVRHMIESLMRDYQAAGPGSQTGSRFLLSIADECRTLVRKLLLSQEEQNRVAVEVYPGTSRAIEVCLSRMIGAKSIVLSPYEHPTVREIGEWLSSTRRCDLFHVTFEAADYLSSWERQAGKIVGAIAKRFSSRDAWTFVLSEVCYSTGRVIPTMKLAKRLAEEGYSPSLIIDGAHSAGNIGVPLALNGCDAYVCSPHKWLLCPEPCGIVFWPFERKTVIPYDCWGDALPVSTAGARRIVSLCAGLRALDAVGYANVRQYCLGLRDRFLSRVERILSAVGEGTALECSLLVTVRPRLGLRWKLSADQLRNYLERELLHALVLLIDPDVPWVRLAFTSINRIEQVDRLCCSLEAVLIRD